MTDPTPKLDALIIGAHPDDAEILKRGVNLIQLYNDGSRWWVTSVLWDNERSGSSVPTDWY